MRCSEQFAALSSACAYTIVVVIEECRSSCCVSPIVPSVRK